MYDAVTALPCHVTTQSRKPLIDRSMNYAAQTRAILCLLRPRVHFKNGGPLRGSLRPNFKQAFAAGFPF